MTPQFRPGAPIFPPDVVADMVELLLMEETQWPEVEALLIEHPNALRYIQLLRETGTPRFFLFGRTPLSDFAIDEEARQLLMAQVFPYATLLDNRLSPLDQARQLEGRGVDVPTFCAYVQEDDPLYRNAARTVFAAWRDHQTLLRGTVSAPASPEQLLRSTAPTPADTDALLLPSYEEDASPTQNPAPWWLRFLKRIGLRGR